MVSSGLRYLTLWLARGLGAVCDLLRKPVALNLLLLFVVAGTLATADRMSGLSWSGLRGALVARPGGEPPQGPVDTKAPAPPVKPSPPPTGGTQPTVPAAGRVWLTPWNVLSVWAFGLLTWSVVRARRRLVVTRFEDFTDKRAGLDVAGFGVLVAAQLSSLNELFRQFEPGSAIQATPARLTPLNATFEADSAGPELEKAVSSEASFALGPLRLPVGFVMGLVGRLVQ